MGIYTRNKNSIRAMIHPKRKREIKQSMNKKRRKLLQKGLDEIKKAYNNGLEINNIDYYKDNEFIKIKPRQGVDADFIERRTTNSRLILGDCW